MRDASCEFAKRIFRMFDSSSIFIEAGGGKIPRNFGSWFYINE